VREMKALMREASSPTRARHVSDTAAE
jgi:hypothetical protein